MDFEKIGRTRLMMRLPQHRKLISEGSFLALTNLLEAYGRATVKRDELRAQPATAAGSLEVYEERCQRLENDVRSMLANVSLR